MILTTFVFTEVEADLMIGQQRIQEWRWNYLTVHGGYNEKTRRSIEAAMAQQVTSYSARGGVK